MGYTNRIANMEKNIKYKMIDLGLPSGLKWANKNIGATKPEEYGDYFMYGSTTPDTNKHCGWSRLPFNNYCNVFNKEYFNAHKSEWFTENGTLKPEYDSATQIMGSSWRMPTSAEMQELVNGTTQSVKTLRGVKGMCFTSKANGNSIFMPFASFRYGSDVYNVGYYGHAWSSSLEKNNPYFSYSLDFSHYGDTDISNYNRFYGTSVRGVHE